jgi:subfamily B ATP-binding cassette protein MsbA
MSLVGLVGVMFFQDWKLALVSFFVFPIALYPIVQIGRRIRRVTADTQQEMGYLTTALSQTFQGIRIVKAYGMVVYEGIRIGRIIDTIRDLNMKAARTRELSRPIMETLGGVAIFIVIIYGGSRVIAEVTTAGAFFSFITALLMAYEPMKRLANLNASIQEGMASAERLFSVLDCQPCICEKIEGRTLSEVKGEIDLVDVHFSYSSGEKILNGLTMQVGIGQTVALVGTSGGGKSTILNMIPRFYEVDQGIVSIDGVDVRDITFESLYSNLALVNQEVTLFDETIRSNIAYGCPGATQQDIEQAAQHAAAHDFILSFPLGYDTLVGEQGVRLSGGQRQRLAIARAMLKNAPILLLDEATSALDTESERSVQKALKALMNGRTTLVIAHRLSTVKDADKICVVEKGRIVEQGKHSELLMRNGVYKRLYNFQFSEQNKN